MHNGDKLEQTIEEEGAMQGEQPKKKKLISQLIAALEAQAEKQHKNYPEIPEAQGPDWSDAMKGSRAGQSLYATFGKPLVVMAAVFTLMAGWLAIEYSLRHKDSKPATTEQSATESAPQQAAADEQQSEQAPTTNAMSPYAQQGMQQAMGMLGQSYMQGTQQATGMAYPNYQMQLQQVQMQEMQMQQNAQAAAPQYGSYQQMAAPQGAMPQAFAQATGQYGASQSPMLVSQVHPPRLRVFAAR